MFNVLFIWRLIFGFVENPFSALLNGQVVFTSAGVQYKRMLFVDMVNALAGSLVFSDGFLFVVACFLFLGGRLIIGESFGEALGLNHGEVVRFGVRVLAHLKLILKIQIYHHYMLQQLGYAYNVLVTIIGIIVLRISLVQFIRFAYKLFIRKPYDLAERYGQNTWVMITGSSEGIGKAFAIAFAKRGFNVIISGRSMEKLKKCEQEIKNVNASVQVKIIQLDFAAADTLQFITDKILPNITGLDVSVLINNVGSPAVGLSRMTDQQCLEFINVNMRTTALLSRMFLPILQKRSKKSAIINLSSLMQYLPFPNASIYGASKKFNEFLTVALSYEYPNLDIISYPPSFVSTPMILNAQQDFFIVSPDHAVQSFLRDLGHQNTSSGPFSHKLQKWLATILPEQLLMFSKSIAPKKMREIEQHFNPS